MKLKHKIIKLKTSQSDVYCNLCGRKEDKVALIEYNLSYDCIIPDKKDINSYPITFKICDRCLLYIHDIVTIYYEEKNSV